MTKSGQKVKDVIDNVVEKAEELAQEAKGLVSKGTDKAREAAKSIGRVVEETGHAIADTAKQGRPK